MSESLLLTKARKILCNTYGGKHHIPGKLKEDGIYIECNVLDGLATFDFAHLTRLVLGAHDECCRLEIRASGPGRLKLRFSERKRPEECGDYPLMLGHATIEQAIRAFREGDRYDQLPKTEEAKCDGK